MASQIIDSQPHSATALAHAAAQYADAKNRADTESAAAWRKVIYSLVESKQHAV